MGIAYARCAVRQHEDAAVAFLSLPVGTQDSEALSKAIPFECLGNPVGDIPRAGAQMKVPTLLMRGLLFETLYARKYGKQRIVPTLERALRLEYPVAGFDAPGETIRRDYRALMKIGDCTVRLAPERVSVLLSTAAGSKAERSGLTDLQEAWLGCLPGQRALPFSIEMVRATLAEPIYRLTQALSETPA
jgi:hypothetical protein